MALLQPPPHELNPTSANEISTDTAEELSLPEEQLQHQLTPSPQPQARPSREIYLISAKIALVLLLGISYFTFCFIVHYHHISIGPRGVLGLPKLPFLQFNILSVITTGAILIIHVALWPMKGVIDEIRAEEFFRLIHTHPNGIPLDSVNDVSAPTTGIFDIIMATVYSRCSLFLSSTFVFSLVIIVISSIAPAALSAGSISIDVDNSTFLIGALPRNSFITADGIYTEGDDPDVDTLTFLPMASSMAWVENFLNFTNGYYKVTSSEDDQFDYLVPFPPGYTSTMKAYWTTDVITIDPSCSWQTATTTGPVKVNPTDSDSFMTVAGFVNSTWNVTLVESNSIVRLRSGVDFVTTLIPANKTQASVLPHINKSSESTIPADGSVLFVIDQFGLPEYYRTESFAVNLSSIPTLKFPTGNVLAFLLCYPHVSIQTRQVRSTGNGNLTLGKHQQSQGNIDFYQANYLLSSVLLEFATSSGPTSFSGQVGSDLMQKLIFGSPGQPTSCSDIVVCEPAPLADIASVYGQIIQSAMKTFLSGIIATEIVPGGYTEEKIVFTSSLGHVLTSAILFVLLTIALVAAQFRKRRAAFTFVNVAAALADSDVPQKCVKMEQSKLPVGMGKRRVLKLVQSDDGQFNCVYQNIDQDSDAD